MNCSSKAFFRRTILRVPVAMALLVLACCAGLNGNLHAADVVYVSRSDTPSNVRSATDTASKFYGLRMIEVAVDGSQRTLLDALRRPGVVAMIVSADSIEGINRQELFSALHARHLPLLIADVRQMEESRTLQQWSRGVIKSVNSTNGQPILGLAIAKTKESGPLGGNTLSVDLPKVSYFNLEGNRAVRPIISAVLKGSQVPVFAASEIETEQVFFSTLDLEPVVSAKSDPALRQKGFAALAPYLIFLRAAAGDRAWHSVGHYANLTIDDAWLEKSYGFADYAGLLQHMEQHNFHTTIAFVPWNFDRSESSVVELFRANADRFSVCIHGNNHDHQEFEKGRPYQVQVNNIKQALARMRRFREVTNIPYDDVMVFPHEISTTSTLAALKRYNFEATANSQNVPVDGKSPSDPGFALHAGTLAYSNFLSLRRYSAEVPILDADIAIDAFLGNPLLFYVHQAFFSPGIGAFDRVAETVNRIQPDVEWRSLGSIGEHMYLERRREDGDFDVLSYARRIVISNPGSTDAIFHVSKTEDFSLPVSVKIDEKDYEFERSEDELGVTVPVSPHTQRRVEISYRNDLELHAVDISKSSIRVRAIRYLSDFRDDVLSKSSFGRRFVASYSSDPAMWRIATAAVLTVLLAAVAIIQMRRRKPESRLRARGGGVHVPPSGIC